jgi:hypothetical protein
MDMVKWFGYFSVFALLLAMIISVIVVNANAAGI